MSKKDQLNKLFEEWQNDDIFKNDFYKDGIVNESKWEKSKIKILYILKEVHETGNTSVCDFLKSNDIQKGYEEKSSMWRKIAYLSYGILNSKECGKNIEIKDMRTQRLYCDAIEHVAIINIKKCAGGATASSIKSKEKETFENHAKKYAELIRRQIKIIEPNIIICCNTFNELKKYVLVQTDNVENNEYAFQEEIVEERFSINILKNNCIVYNNFHPTTWNWTVKKCNYFDPIVEYCKNHFDAV